MKHKDITNRPEERILATALNAIFRTAGVKGEVDNNFFIDQKHRPDAVVNLYFEKEIKKYLVEIKVIDRVERLNLVKNRFNAFPEFENKLLIAPYITTEMADYCRNHGIQFIDAAGNGYLNGEGIRVYIVGHKRNLDDVVNVNERATTATGMRVVFALLCRPELMYATYREIAAAADVALGTVGRVLTALENRGQMLVDARGKRQFVDVKGAIADWVQNYPIRLKPKLFATRFHAPDVGWWKNVDLNKYGALFGGEVAADVLTHYRPPGEILIYMPGDPTQIILDNRLHAAPHGEVRLVEKFWDFEVKNTENIVPPLLIYADLMATEDPRNHELAKIIYEKHVLNAYR